MPSPTSTSKTSIVPISFGAVGALVASRQPRNVIGWLFLSIAIISALQGLSDQYARYGFITHPGAPAAVWAFWLDSWVISFVFPCGALALLLLLFPDGHLPVATMAAARVDRSDLLAADRGAAVRSAPGSCRPRRPSRKRSIRLASRAGSPSATIFDVLGFAWLLGFVVLVVAQPRHSCVSADPPGDERLQLKWIATAVLVSAVAAVIFELAEAVHSRIPTGV